MCAACGFAADVDLRVEVRLFLAFQTVFTVGVDVVSTARLPFGVVGAAGFVRHEREEANAQNRQSKSRNHSFYVAHVDAGGSAFFSGVALFFASIASTKRLMY